MDFDTYWKGEAVKIAAMEQFETEIQLDTTLLFERAKMIYNEGYLSHIDKWDEFLHGKKKKEGVVKKASKNMKICPKCNEEVPVGWKEHKYKQDKTVCGFVFKSNIIP